MSLHPGRTALLMIDLQVDVVHPSGAFADSGAPEYAERHGILANVQQLAAAARAAGIPVIHVHNVHTPGYPDVRENAPLFRDIVERGALVRGTPGVEPIAEATPQDGDIVIEKERMSAFHGTSLEVKLQGLGVDTVIVSGAWTNFAVEHTSRHAADAGYRVVLATDATVTRDEDWQAAALEHALSAVTEQMTVAALVEELAPTAGPATR